jgi:cation transport ATPase
LLRLLRHALHGRFGADHLAGVSIVASVLLGEYLAGAVVVLMLSSGEALEAFVVAKATSVLRALTSRVPTFAHRRRNQIVEDVPIPAVLAGDDLLVRPHEICPIDGDVIEGHGTMDESYLTGESFTIAKGPGSAVLSGAINGDAPLVVRATRIAADSPLRANHAGDAGCRAAPADSAAGWRSAWRLVHAAGAVGGGACLVADWQSRSIPQRRGHHDARC